MNYLFFSFRHYGTNRAPMSLSFDTSWLLSNKGFTRELATWMRKILLDHSDVYFVTHLQVWKKNPCIFELIFTCWFWIAVLEPVCFKKWQKIVPDLTALRSRGPLKDLKDSKLILNESKLFPWSSRISLVPLRIFWGPLFPKPVSCQELFLTVSYCKLALVMRCHIYIST